MHTTSATASSTIIIRLVLILTDSSICVIPIYITKDLVWYTGGMLRHIDSYKDFRLINRYATKVNLINKDGRFVLQKSHGIKREINEIHLAFPIVHGKGVEDGSRIFKYFRYTLCR